jgi:Ca2+-binding RTX toxin-like protein
MSYNADAYGGLEPITLMLYDIATLQMLYGANTTTAAGDTIYDLSTPDYYASNISIWDAGGHDELDGSALSDNLILDLNEGSFSSVGLVNSLSIAYGAYIEDATGGSGDDFLTGNELDNTLSGEAGNDNLYGGEGTDSLFGGAGDDALYYDGQDVLDGGEGVDTLLVSLFEAVIDAGSNLISSIEIFNLDNAGSNTVNITLSDILDLSDNAALYVLGDDGVDNVTVSGGTYQESVSVEGVTYAQYSDGTSNLYVEETLLLVSV